MLLAADHGRVGDIDHVVGIVADNSEIAADASVMIHRVVAFAEAGEQVVGDLSGVGDRQRVVAVEAGVAQRSSDRAGELGSVSAVA